MVRAFIGIGANLGNREATLREAGRRLNALPDTRVTRRSSLLETDPVGPRPQPRYLNGVLELETALAPKPLLEHMLSIESALGRVRKADAPRWGPRPIDLDLLWYDGRSIEEPDLRVPHPEMAGRDFVMIPLKEIAPDVASLIRKDVSS